MPPDPLLFPHPEMADADGLLAIGGDLSPERLLVAYHFGIFPWYSENQPLLWWSPDPRCVLFPSRLSISKSMRTVLRKQTFQVTVDQNFEQIIHHCSKVKRRNQTGTWITKDMIDAYLNLHQMGYAHSVEVRTEKSLVGGLYGISLGKIFFGESMFSLIPNASKFGFIRLVQILNQEGFSLIDCQQDTPHLRSLGAELISRKHFLKYLRKNQLIPDDIELWSRIQAYC